MTSPLKVFTDHYYEQVEASNSCDPSVRRKYQFEKKKYYIQQFESMRNYVDKRCQTISDKRLKDTEKHLYENYFKCILRLPTPKLNMKNIYAAQQNIIDKINSYEKKHQTLNTEPDNFLCWDIIRDELKYFSKHFYALGFDDIDMDVKTLRAFSEHRVVEILPG